MTGKKNSLKKRYRINWVTENIFDREDIIVGCNIIETESQKTWNKMVDYFAHCSKWQETMRQVNSEILASIK